MTRSVQLHRSKEMCIRDSIYAGPARDIPEGEGYDVVDITGKTIIPGLVDAHLHFSGNLTENDNDWVLEDNIQKAVVAVPVSYTHLDVYKRQLPKGS